MKSYNSSKKEDAEFSSLKMRSNGNTFSYGSERLRGSLEGRPSSFERRAHGEVSVSPEGEEIFFNEVGPPSGRYNERSFPLLEVLSEQEEKRQFYH